MLIHDKYSNIMENKKEVLQMISKESQEMVKQYIRVNIDNLTAKKLGKRLDERFNEARDDEYVTIVDSGFEDLDLREDATKIQLYMNCDILTLNNGKYYKVIKRIFQPNRPVMLHIEVEEIE